LNVGNALCGSNFTVLCIYGANLEEYSDWNTHPERFKNITETLGESRDVKENLKMLRLHSKDNHLSKEFYEDALSKNGLGGVTVSF
jgi:hypothetical protein